MNLALKKLVGANMDIDLTTPQDKIQWNQDTCYTAKETLVTGVFVLPKEKRWWIEIPRGRPELLGLEHLELFFPERIDASSPWSRGLGRPTLSVAPCDSDCKTCLYYQTQCARCPAVNTTT